MKPLNKKKPMPPKDYLVTEAKYTGVTGKKNCRFTVGFKIYVFKRNSLSYINIPILSANTAVSDISVDGVPGVMQTVGGWYKINLLKRGYHEVKASFSVENHKQSISFPIIRSIINSIDFTAPFNDYEIHIDSALIVQMTDKTASHIIANIPPVNRMNIKWHLKSKKREKKPALFYGETHSLISVSPDILKIRTQVDLEVLQSSLNNIAMRIPDSYEVVEVSGSSIKDWRVRETETGRILEIHLGFDIDSRYQFTVSTERMLAVDTLAVVFEGLEIVDARRETGVVGIVAESAAEVEVRSNQDLEKLEFHQLPQKILAMSSLPVLYSYKYSRHPYRLDITIHKHQQLEGISTVIESAVGTILFLQEGKMLNKMNYSVHNSYKQFMELELPQDSIIWTVMVDNKREKASRNKKGKVLIPLVRSSGNGDRLKSFKVQLIYTQPWKKFRLKGSSQYFFPKTDIFINKIQMELFLPEGYSYHFDKGEWKEEIPLLTSGETAGSDKFMDSISETSKPSTSIIKDEVTTGSMVVKKSEEYKSQNTAQEMISAPGRKVKKNWRQSFTGPVGLSSISVYLPISGRKFLFSKKIIDKYETYPLSFSYFHQPTLHGIYLLLGIFLFLVLSFFIYRRFKNPGKNRK
jgi:hypothetical protein